MDAIFTRALAAWGKLVADGCVGERELYVAWENILNHMGAPRSEMVTIGERARASGHCLLDDSEQRTATTTDDMDDAEWSKDGKGDDGDEYEPPFFPLVATGMTGKGVRIIDVALPQLRSYFARQSYGSGGNGGGRGGAGPWTQHALLDLDMCLGEQGRGAMSASLATVTVQVRRGDEEKMKRRWGGAIMFTSVVGVLQWCGVACAVADESTMY